MLPAPVPPRVGEVEEALSRHREVGLALDPEVPEVILLPEVAVVVPGEGAAVHADRPDIAEGPERPKFLSEEGDRLCVVAVGLREHLIVVANLVAEGENLFDRLGKEGVRVPEVVGRMDAEGVFELCHLQGVLGPAVDVVTEDDSPALWGVDEVPVDRHRGVAGVEEGVAEFPVLFHREVPHHPPQ